MRETKDDSQRRRLKDLILLFETIAGIENERKADYIRLLRTLEFETYEEAWCVGFETAKKLYLGENEK